MKLHRGIRNLSGTRIREILVLFSFQEYGFILLCSENWSKVEFKDNEVICFKEGILRQESIQPMVCLHFCVLL